MFLTNKQSKICFRRTQISRERGGEEIPTQHNIILLDCRGSDWFCGHVRKGGGASSREWAEGLFGSRMTIVGVVNKAACVMYGAGLERRRVSEGVGEGGHTVAESLTGRVCVPLSLSWEPEVHVETRCLSGNTHEWGMEGTSGGLPPKREHS